LAASRYHRNRVLATRSRNRSLLRWIGTALYAAMLVMASFEHHDIACHFKNPQHCTACTASQIGTGPHTSATPGTSQLSDAGDAASFKPLCEGVLLAYRSTGRSPPVFF
jgi:hypothetical protein